MPLYRKKPVVVQARGPVELGNPVVMDSLSEWCGGRATVHGIAVNTHGGELWAHQGAMIVQSIDGKFYPVDGKVFDLTYEKLLSVRPNDILIGDVAPAAEAAEEIEHALRGSLA